jgi:O-antigen/teichoic acid export membrane protein
MVSRLLNRINTLTSVPRQCVSVLRLKNFDTSTPAGRSKERYRRAALTSLSQAFAKGIAILTMLISVPLTLHYLGPERYGMWMTISSVILMLGLADLGMGLGLLNSVSEAHGHDDRQAAAGYVSSGLVMLSAMAFIILLLFAIAYPFIPWPKIFNVKTPLAAHEAGPVMAAFLACFALNLPLGVVQRVQLAYQEGFFNSLWESVGKILGLLGLLLVIYLKAGLVWLVLAVAGAPCLARLLNSLILFGRQHPWLRPRLKYFNSGRARKIFKLGLSFFVLTMLVKLTYSSDNLIIAQLLGAEAVSQYAVPAQMFGFCIIIMNMVISPLWPAYGEAMARGEIAWAAKTLSRTLVLLLFMVGVPSMLLVILGPWLLKLWVGPQISPSFPLLLGFGVWTLILSLGSSMSIFLNAASIFRFQIICNTFAFISSLLAKIFLARLWGLPGIVWGAIIAYLFCFVIPYAFYIRHLFYKLHQSETPASVALQSNIS